MLVRRCLTAPVAEASDSEKLGLHGLRKYQNLSTRGCSTSDPHHHYNWSNTFFSKGERETTPANVYAINLLTAKALIFRPPESLHPRDWQRSLPQLRGCEMMRPGQAWSVDSYQHHSLPSNAPINLSIVTIVMA